MFNLKLISPRVHGIIDYLVVVFLLAAPSLFALSPTTATIAYALGGVHLLLTVLTAFPAGLYPLIPLRVHGLIELVVGLLLLVAPWVLNVSEHPADYGFLTGFGVAVLLVWVLTYYSAPLAGANTAP